jgi:hypothetical protein
VTRRETDATTLTLLPGHSEDTPGDGHRLDSAMPDYWDKSLDAWFVADQVTDLPDDLRDALEMRRMLPEYDEPLRQYRVRNTVDVAFTTPDGRTVIDETVRVRTNAHEPPSYVAIEGQTGEDNVVRDVVERDDIHWFDDRAKLRADTDRFESGAVRETVRSVEGVRASVLTGGRDEFIVRMKEKFDELGPAEFLERTGMDVEAVPAFIVEPPTMYTFLDLVVMADGATLARVWDATPYPKHYLYVDGDKVAETAFEEGEHWEPREDTNRRFGQWVMEEQDAQTPFTPEVGVAYERYLDVATVWEPYRGLQYGADGEELSARELSVALPAPQFPWRGN